MSCTIEWMGGFVYGKIPREPVVVRHGSQRVKLCISRMGSDSTLAEGVHTLSRPAVTR